MQEVALAVLANLMCGDAETRLKVLVGSRMGKHLSDKLEDLKVRVCVGGS